MSVQNACIVCDFSKMRTVHLVNVIWNITMKYGRNLRSLLLKFKNLSSLLRDNPSFHSRQHSGEKYFFISLLPFLVPLTRWIWFKNIFGYNSFQIIILFVLYSTVYLTMRIFTTYQTRMYVPFLFSWNMIK